MKIDNINMFLDLLVIFLGLLVGVIYVLEEKGLTRIIEIVFLSFLCSLSSYNIIEKLI